MVRGVKLEMAARQAKKDGKKSFMFAGKEYPCTVGEEYDKKGKKVGKWNYFEFRDSDIIDK